MAVATDRLSGLSTSVAVKAPCRVAATSNITLAGLQTVNGIALAEGDRVLVMGQTDATTNGIYNASTSGWTRAKDFNGNRDVTQGTLVIVVGSGVYEVTTANPITIGTSSLAFSIQTITLSQPINVTDYGLVPNDNSTAAKNANTTALKALISPSNVGGVYSFRGRVHFVNTGGSDVYYLNDIIQVRDGIHLDLCGGTLNFAKTYAAADDLMGFLTFIRDVTIENGSIVVDYDGTGGTNAGAILRIGSRVGYPFATFSSGEEEDLSDPMGNIVLRNLTLTTNNTAVSALLLLGGLRAVRIENVDLDGSGVVTEGIQYEWGYWHYEATVANIKTTHASGLHFSNLRIHDLDDSVSGSGAIEITGAAESILDNVTVDGANSGFVFRPGEALFFNVGTPDTLLTKRCMTIRNFRAKNVVTGMQLKGAEAASGGYLSGSGLTDAQQRDLMRFSVDGGVINASGQGIYVLGPCDMRNMTLNGSASSGQLVVGDDCIRGAFTNMEIRSSSSIGVRANVGDTISGMTARLKTLTFTECQVAGNTQGYSIGHTQSVRINGGRIGYQTALDGQSESTQSVGVSVDQTSLGGGVYCYGVDVATSGGSAYSITGAITNPCGVFDPKGTISFTGTWDIDGVGRENATNIADKTVYPNIAGKYVGRLVYDSSNTRLMIAQGSANTSAWVRADGGATVTPST